MSGTIDIVCNLFTPQEVQKGQTGLDDEFKAQVRMPEEIRGGVSIEDYLGRMDRAPVDRLEVSANGTVLAFADGPDDGRASP